MFLKTNWISVNTIISDLYLTIPSDAFNEFDLKEILYNGATNLVTYKWYEHEVCIVPVVNHKAVLPRDIKSLEFAMYKKESPDKLQEQIITITARLDSSPDAPYQSALMNGDALVVGKKLISELTSCSSCMSNWQFLGMSYSTLSMLSSSSCSDSPSRCKCSETFTMNYACNSITTSFESGLVMFAYKTFAKDDEGNMVIPDIPEVINALKTYVKMLYWEKKDFEGEQGAFNKLQTLKREWELVSANAKMRQMMPLEEDYIKVAKNNKLFHTGSPWNVFLDNGRMQTNYI